MAKRRFHWDPVNDFVTHETDGAGSTLVSYTHEPGEFGPLISETRGGTTYTHHYDALGSTTLLSDDMGAVTDTFQYDAWGNRLGHAGNILTPYSWCGRWGYFDDNDTIGGFYVRARNYQPVVARWTSVDPMAIRRPARRSKVWGAYVYARQTAVLKIDPSGLQSIGCSAGAGTIGPTKFESNWSIGGDDPDEDYETASVKATFEASNCQCCKTKDCNCRGDITIQLNYEAKVGGRDPGGAMIPASRLGLCHVPRSFERNWEGFTFERFQPPLIEGNYTFRFRVTATISIGFVPCTGGSLSGHIAVSRRDTCGNLEDREEGNIRQFISYSVSAAECGKANIVFSLTTLPGGFDKIDLPARQYGCEEERYPPYIP